MWSQNLQFWHRTRLKLKVTWDRLFCYWCYFPNTARDSVSPVCEIFGLSISFCSFLCLESICIALNTIHFSFTTQHFYIKQDQLDH